MQIKAENLLNPFRYHLSTEAKKRLRWMYVIYYECGNNVTLAANKVGLSREWLSKLKSKFESSGKNPRSLEPKSKAPHHTDKRERISKGIEAKIIEVRDKYGWGERKIVRVLDRDYDIKTSKNTVNRYLHKHQRINPKISERNEKAWREKKIREELEAKPSLKAKYRPPAKIKDYAPGALVEKDMKLVPKMGKFSPPMDKYHLKDYFNFQHTFEDSFTRIRHLDLTKEPSSEAAKAVWQEAKNKFPFAVATTNTDNGGENAKEFAKELKKDEIVQFYSRTGTPTDNPRVERSHLTDEQEFYQRGNFHQAFEDQRETLKGWDYIYNNVRPHQALGQLTPMEFYQLWKRNPNQAYQIVAKYQAYLKRQSQRLANSRRMKKKEQIEKLMQFIDAKLNQKADLNAYKLELVRCELCSWG